MYTHMRQGIDFDSKWSWRLPNTAVGHTNPVKHDKRFERTTNRIVGYKYLQVVDLKNLNNDKKKVL